MFVSVVRHSIFSLMVLALLPMTVTAREKSGVPVVVSPAHESAISEVIQLTGTVTAVSDARLSVSTGGLVTTLEVDAGDRVEQGQELLGLDAELARYQYHSARAALTQAQHAFDDARRRHEEAKVLAPQRSIAESVVKDLAAEVLEDEAALEEVRANAGYRKGVLDRHRLLAPFSGVISSRSVELGEWVSPGQPVLRLVSTENLRLDFQVPEDYLGQVEVGAKVEFTLGADRGSSYGGTVLTIVPITDATVRTFLLRVKADEQLAEMLPGMSVQVDVNVDADRQGVIVPRDAVLRYADGRAVVWVVQNQDGHQVARERFVRTGLNFKGKVEVQQGIDAGELVVVTGNESLRDGQALSITEQIGP